MTMLQERFILSLPCYPTLEQGLNTTANYIASFLKHGLETSLHSSVPTISSLKFVAED